MNASAVACFHCGLDVPNGTSYSVSIDGIQQPMCCPGCQAVAQAIVDNHLTDYYKYRTAPAVTARDVVPDILKKLVIYDNPALQQQFVTTQQSGAIKETSLILEGIVCAACIWLNERHVSALPGVVEFRVNFSTHRASLRWDESRIHLSEILQAITAIGYLAHPVDAQRQEQVHKRERNRALRRLAVAGLGAMQVMMLAVALYAGAYYGIDSSLAQFFRWISWFVATPVLTYSAWPFYQAAWRDLRRWHLGMDVPVALSIFAAYIASSYATITAQQDVYFDSVTMFVFFLLTGRYLEMQARHRAGEAAESMIKLIPAMTNKILHDGREQIIAVMELVPGDVVRVKPGETVPADGVVIAGTSSVNESLLTGESLPIRKQRGMQVIGGSLNVESPLEIRIEKVGNQTVLAAIQRLLERAQTEKPDIARLADKTASWFIVGLFILAAVVGSYWWMHDSQRAFWVVIAILVVTCPCALSLATPVALIAATGRLVQLGVLTTRGHALETLAKVTHVVFDKTGTLTTGQLRVEEVVVCGSLSQAQIWQIAASLEQGSEHPLAKAICNNTHTDILHVVDRQAVPGQGVQGFIDGQQYRLGRSEFVWPTGLPSSIDIRSTRTHIALANDQQLLAVFYLEDHLRQDAAIAIRELKSMGLTVSLLSGDHQVVVNEVAQRLEITQATGNLLPEDKLRLLKQGQANGEVIVMVGDGVNDAPVLAAAQVSIAMGNGTQLAQASSDMILLSEQLTHIPLAIAMARQTHRVIRQNLGWAIIYNLLALPLAAIGWVTPWMAGIGMSGSSLLVVLNALGLRRFAVVEGRQ